MRKILGLKLTEEKYRLNSRKTTDNISNKLSVSYLVGSECLMGSLRAISGAAGLERLLPSSAALIRISRHMSSPCCQLNLMGANMRERLEFYGFISRLPTTRHTSEVLNISTENQSEINNTAVEKSEN